MQRSTKRAGNHWSIRVAWQVKPFDIIWPPEPTRVQQMTRSKPLLFFQIALVSTWSHVLLPTTWRGFFFSQPQLFPPFAQRQCCHVSDFAAAPPGCGIRSATGPTGGHPEPGGPCKSPGDRRGPRAPLVETWRYYLGQLQRFGKSMGEPWNFQVLRVFQPLTKKNTVSCGLVSRTIGSIIPGTMDINGQETSTSLKPSSTKSQHPIMVTFSLILLWLQLTNSFVGPLNSPTTKHIICLFRHVDTGGSPQHISDKPGCGSTVLT